MVCNRDAELREAGLVDEKVFVGSVPQIEQTRARSKTRSKLFDDGLLHLVVPPGESRSSWPSASLIGIMWCSRSRS